MSPVWCILLPAGVEVMWALGLRHYGRRQLRGPATDEDLTNDWREKYFLIAFIVYHWPLVLVLLALKDRNVPLGAMVVALISNAAIYAGVLLWVASPQG